MVGSVTVVAYPPTELGEDEHHYVFGGIMFAQVLEEVAHRAGHVCPQLRLHIDFVAVNVEATYLRVEDACPDARKMHLSDASEIL